MDTDFRQDVMFWAESQLARIKDERLTDIREEHNNLYEWVKNIFQVETSFEMSGCSSEKQKSTLEATRNNECRASHVKLHTYYEERMQTVLNNLEAAMCQMSAKLSRTPTERCQQVAHAFVRDMSDSILKLDPMGPPKYIDSYAGQRTPVASLISVPTAFLPLHKPSPERESLELTEEEVKGILAEPPHPPPGAVPHEPADAGGSSAEAASPLVIVEESPTIEASLAPVTAYGPSQVAAEFPESQQCIEVTTPTEPEVDESPLGQADNHDVDAGDGAVVLTQPDDNEMQPEGGHPSGAAMPSASKRARSPQDAQSAPDDFKRPRVDSLRYPMDMFEGNQPLDADYGNLCLTPQPQADYDNRCSQSGPKPGRSAWTPSPLPDRQLAPWELDNFVPQPSDVHVHGPGPSPDLSSSTRPLNSSIETPWGFAIDCEDSDRD